MIAVPSVTARALDAAAKRRLAASVGPSPESAAHFPGAPGVAPVASGYERSLRPCDARFSPPQRAICSGGDR
jgi:hypothetical protein